MTRFSSLLEPRADLSVGDQQQVAVKHLAALLQESRLHLWAPGTPIAGSGRRILVGVASYSTNDLALLDTLNDVVGLDSSRPRLDVFDVTDCRSSADFEKYVPGIGRVLQTPVVGLWENGVLKETAWGKAGRDLLVNVLDLPH